MPFPSIPNDKVSINCLLLSIPIYINFTTKTYFNQGEWNFSGSQKGKD